MNARIVAWAAIGLAACGGRTVASDATAPSEDASVQADGAKDGPGPGKEAGHEASADAHPPGCKAQQAQGDGACDGGVPGFRWDGEHCVALGSGCACTGADCGAVYATMADCVNARYACYPAPCEPQPVAGNMCIDCYADTYEGTAYTGRDCRDLISCGCVGAGCATMYRSNEECVAVTSRCDAAKCKATGGQWFPASAGFCGFQCGGPRELACESPFADCLCQLGQTFQQGQGCASDATCAQAEACKATGGAWHPMSECFCGFHCGQPGDCDACVDSCDCGAGRNFAGPTGCVMDEACGAWEAQVLCTSSGGTWMDCSQGPCSCGDYVCGQPNFTDPCVMPGCDCGWLRNFDQKYGCTLDASCTLLPQGATCSGFGVQNSSCAPGLACCGHCGVSTGCNTCDTPCCPDDSSCQNGCFPPPP